MRKRPSGNARSLHDEVVSSLPQDCELLKVCYASGQSVMRQDAYDYKIIFIGSGWELPPGSFPASGHVTELSFLECLILREVIKSPEDLSTFVVAVRFGPNVNKGTDGRVLSDFEVLYEKGNELPSLLRHLIGDLSLASPRYPLFDETLPPNEVVSMLDILTRHCVNALRWAKTQNSELVDALGEQLGWLIGPDSSLPALLNDLLRPTVDEAGLAKLLTIPVLSDRDARQRLPLTGEDATRIELIHDVVKPPYGIRPTIDPTSVRAHWAQIAGRLFLYGLLLDFINTLRQEQAVKVCRNCGKLYRPYKYQKKDQHYCSGVCRKRAQSKRRYQKKKESDQDR